MYLGATDIIAMQKAFHAQFDKIHWRVRSVEEVKPGVILFNYNFEASTKSGEVINSSGLEYVVVANGKIQHIEVRNK